MKDGLFRGGHAAIGARLCRLHDHPRRVVFVELDGVGSRALDLDISDVGGGEVDDLLTAKLRDVPQVAGEAIGTVGVGDAQVIVSLNLDSGKLDLDIPNASIMHGKIAGKVTVLVGTFLHTFELRSFNTIR